MTHEQIKQQIISIIETKKARSAWERGVKDYAIEILDNIDDLTALIDKNEKETTTILLNGAPSWHDYSWGGTSLIYDEDIAVRLCTPSELKRTNGGQRRPNRCEEWLDTQARALRHAAFLIHLAIASIS